MAARRSLQEAERGLAGLGNLETARAEVEDVKMTVEAARMTMMAKRSGHDELRREGEARTRRGQEVTKELQGWRHRLETAEKRIAELAERKTASEAELKDATAAPEEIAANVKSLAIRSHRRRRARPRPLTRSRQPKALSVMRHWPSARRSGRQARHARRGRARRPARCGARDRATRRERIEEEQDTTPEALLESLGADPEKMPASEMIETGCEPSEAAAGCAWRSQPAGRGRCEGSLSGA